MFSGVLLLFPRPRSFNVARSDAPIFLSPVFVCVFSLPAFAQRNIALRRNAYPAHYSLAFAFSTILYPHFPQHSLRFACHEGENTGLPCSAYMTCVG